MFIFNTLSGKASAHSGPSLGLEQKCLFFIFATYFYYRENHQIFFSPKFSRQEFNVLRKQQIFSKCLAHLLLVKLSRKQIFSRMSSWYYHKNCPFVSHVADKFCLFFKNIRKSQIFLIVTKTWVIFTLSQANFSYYFRENAKAKFFLSTLSQTTVSYFFATVSFAAVVLAFVNILNSLNRYLIGLLFFWIQGFLVVKLRLLGFLLHLQITYCTYSFVGLEAARFEQQRRIVLTIVMLIFLSKGKTGKHYGRQHWKSERCCGQAESKLHCIFAPLCSFFCKFFLRSLS